MALQIMIVDDSPAMRAFIVRVIQLSGLDTAKCIEAGNGREALAMLHEHPVDIILTDINMPVMNGEEFLRLLDEDARLQTIPVLVVSTDGSAHRMRRMMALRAKGYLTKPFSPEVLRAEMEKLLGAAHE
jgi:two-component system, chemotaxis family, chemotaxis protein CheY